MRSVALIVVLAATALLLVVEVVYGGNETVCVCECHCHCDVDLTPVIERLDRIVELLEAEKSLLQNLTLLQVRSHSTLLNLSRSIAETPGTIAHILNTSTLRTAIANTSNVTPFPHFSTSCSDVLDQILVGLPELRCFAPSTWLGPGGWVYTVNVAVIGLLAAVSTFSIIAGIVSGEEPAEAFRRCGGLLVKCCVAGIFLTLLPNIVSTWNALVYHVVNWDVLNAFKTTWTVMTIALALPPFVPLLGKAIPALEAIPVSIFQAHIAFTLLLALMMYIKLLLALLIQITLPIGIALQEVRIRALRNLGLALESTFWGLLIGTLLSAAMPQLIGGMYVKAGEVTVQGIESTIRGAAAMFTAVGDYVKCSVFGWLFHCSPEDAVQKLLEGGRLLGAGLNMLLIQAPTLLALAVLGSATPLFMVVLTLWKKWTPLQFMDVMIGATTGIYFAAREYARAPKVVEKLLERVEERRRTHTSTSAGT